MLACPQHLATPYVFFPSNGIDLINCELGILSHTAFPVLWPVAEYYKKHMEELLLEVLMQI